MISLDTPRRLVTALIAVFVLALVAAREMRGIKLDEYLGFMFWFTVFVAVFGSVLFAMANISAYNANEERDRLNAEQDRLTAEQAAENAKEIEKIWVVLTGLGEIWPQQSAPGDAAAKLPEVLVLLKRKAEKLRKKAEKGADKSKEKSEKKK